MVQYVHTETHSGVVFYTVPLVKVKHWHKSLVLVLKYCGDPHKTISEESHRSGLNILNAPEWRRKNICMRFYGPLKP